MQLFHREVQHIYYADIRVKGHRTNGVYVKPRQTKKKEEEVPQESRKRKRKEFYGERGSAEFHPQNLEEKSRITYYTVYDHVIGQIQERFDQPDYKVYAAMESILIDGMMGKPIDCHLNKEIKCACKTRCDCKALTVKELYKKEICSKG